MEPALLLDALTALAKECGVAVRGLRSGGDGTPGLTSGPARVRGQAWVVLVLEEPIEARIRALAAGLVQFAGTSLESRYVPPAVRACLDRAAAKAR